MKKMVVILLVLVMVFVMVGGVVAADGHGGPRHGGLGYWMNYEYEDGWTAICGRDDQLFTSVFRTSPRGCARWLLYRHHMIAWLNLTEVHHFTVDQLFFGCWYVDLDESQQQILPQKEFEAFQVAFWENLRPALMRGELDADNPDYSRNYTRCERRDMLELKDILEDWNEGR